MNGAGMRNSLIECICARVSLSDVTRRINLSPWAPILWHIVYARNGTLNIDHKGEASSSIRMEITLTEITTRFKSICRRILTWMWAESDWVKGLEPGRSIQDKTRWIMAVDGAVTFVCPSNFTGFVWWRQRKLRVQNIRYSQRAKHLRLPLKIEKFGGRIELNDATVKRYWLSVVQNVSGLND